GAGHGRPELRAAAEQSTDAMEEGGLYDGAAPEEQARKERGDRALSLHRVGRRQGRRGVLRPRDGPERVDKPGLDFANARRQNIRATGEHAQAVARRSTGERALVTS